MSAWTGALLHVATIAYAIHIFIPMQRWPKRFGSWVVVFQTCYFEGPVFSMML